jgi:lysophospholipid acyltransferase (LPLAT)-like uncharacterized protein
MSERPAWESSWSKRAQVAVIVGLLTPIVRLLGATWRWRVEGLAHLDAAHANGRSVIHAFWHGRILPGTVYFQRRGIVVLTSQNFDGEWIARIIHRFGYGTARGSSSRGSRAAMRQLLRDVREKDVAFPLDGPRGPARVAQPGAIWLSRATGSAVLPFHFEAARHWSLRSWDRTQIPKPFTTIAVVFDAPFVVPREVSDEDLDAFRQKLEQALASCERRCLELAGRAEAPGSGGLADPGTAA